MVDYSLVTSFVFCLPLTVTCSAVFIDILGTCCFGSDFQATQYFFFQLYFCHFPSGDHFQLAT